MGRLPVLIDCDGQLDSFWGLILAKELLDIRAVTVSRGKQKEAETAFDNVLGYAAMMGLRCPLGKGSERAVLLREKPEWNPYPPDGKCGLPFPTATVHYEEKAAWDLIYETAKEVTGETAEGTGKEMAGGLTILCFGPMTNLALALFKYPDLSQYIKKIAFVGGSYDFGNYTGVSEINMATDPEAAKAIFQSRIPMEMYGYNAERKVALTNKEIGSIVDGAKGPFSTAFLMSCMSHSPEELIYYGPALAAMGMGEPESVTKERYHVMLETKSSACRGRTVPLNMYYPLGYPKDTLVAMDADKDRYVALLRDTFAKYETL